MRPWTVPHSYRWCSALTRRTARNFIYAFQVLPRAQRRGMDALYAFMRVTDDLSDEPGEVACKSLALQQWRRQLQSMMQGTYAHPLHPALHDTVCRYRIPLDYLDAVIEGVQADLGPVRIQTFAQLHDYCYRVASVVGLACIHIWGFSDRRAIEPAVAAGVALQLTNILRDLGEDLQRDRVYLPLEECERFGCPPERWVAESTGERFMGLMRFQANRAEAYYQQSQALSRYLTPSGRAVFQAMRGMYYELFRTIQARRFQVFGRRVRVEPWKKVALLLGAFPVAWGWR